MIRVAPPHHAYTNPICPIRACWLCFLISTITISTIIQGLVICVPYFPFSVSGDTNSAFENVVQLCLQVSDLRRLFDALYRPSDAS